MNRILVPILAVLAAAGLAFTSWGVFVATPMEQALFYSQKIFYYHVPNAFMLFLGMFVCGIASLAFLKKRSPALDDLAVAAAEVTALHGVIVLVTGSIWARAAWGHWWIWEPRLVTSLLLVLIVIGCVLVRKFGGAGSDRLAAGLAVFGMVDVPLIYFGVKQGDSHPQPTTPKGAGVVQTLDTEMKLTFWLSVLTFAILFTMLLITRYQAARAERTLREAHERGLDSGLLEA